ncbi:MAG: diaminopimelate epimerase [Actinomycetia bacterium]|nr:diaminopimelate epimerase [Actinomycetes bacterium]MCP4227914.1 diaminopimelate epimerase [Actinomycetes bacterium]
MLTKHHGLGNDFLIAVSPTLPLGPDQARQWCDRRRGIGADGLISAHQLPDDSSTWTMQLWNADGSRAELSGNGLRCLGQALLLHYDEGLEVSAFQVITDAGPRRVEIRPERISHTDSVTVDMGRAKPGPSPWSRWGKLGVEVRRELGVDMGNPHLVCLVDDLSSLDLASIGPVVESDYAEGLNLEFITVLSRQAISLRVWERGAGITEACGSGACAAVWAANQWGLVDGRAAVTMPGGEAWVEVVDDNLVLSGPATFVAVVEVEHS